MLQIESSELARVLPPVRRPTLGRSPRPKIVTLEFDAQLSEIKITDASHAAFERAASAAGEWPEPVQFDAARLALFAKTFKAPVTISLTVTGFEIIATSGMASCRIMRVDGRNGPKFIPVPVGPDKRHKGKFEMPPEEGRRRTEYNHTWGFTARVPMPRDDED